jgi:hypothetical protein
VTYCRQCLIQPRGGRQKKEEISRQPLEPYFCRLRTITQQKKRKNQQKLKNTLDMYKGHIRWGFFNYQIFQNVLRTHFLYERLFGRIHNKLYNKNMRLIYLLKFYINWEKCYSADGELKNLCDQKCPFI